MEVVTMMLRAARKEIAALEKEMAAYSFNRPTAACPYHLPLLPARVTVATPRARVIVTLMPTRKSTLLNRALAPAQPLRCSVAPPLLA